MSIALRRCNFLGRKQGGSSMNRVIGIISSNYQSDFLRDIAQHRPIAAVPFGGRYRLCDFALSSMVNSGVRTAGLITPYYYRPLLDHLGGGKAWDLDRKVGGMFILPGSTSGLRLLGSKFLLQDYRKNIEFLQRDHAEYVILSGSDAIYNVNFRPVIQQHEEKGADISLLYRDIAWHKEQGAPGILLQTGIDGRVLDMDRPAVGEAAKVKQFLDILIIGRRLLLEIMREQSELTDVTDVVEKNLRVLKVYSYAYQGYYGKIDSIQSYYKSSMEMLQPAVRNQLFMGDNRIYTKILDNPPTKYGMTSTVQNALVSSGCHIRGEVAESIVFRGVEVEEGATVRNCIVMQRSKIEKGAIVENAILDKHVRVRANTVLRGSEHSPVVVKKGSVI